MKIRLSSVIFVVAYVYLIAFFLFNSQFFRCGADSVTSDLSPIYQEKVEEAEDLIEGRPIFIRKPSYEMYSETCPPNARLYFYGKTYESKIVFTKSILEYDKRQLSAIIAHEWAHLETFYFNEYNPPHYKIDIRAIELTSGDLVIGVLDQLLDDGIRYFEKNKFWYYLFFSADEYKSRYDGVIRRINILKNIELK